MTDVDSTPANDARDGNDDRRSPGSGRGRRIARHALLGVFALFMVFGSLLAWIVFSPNGTRWAAGQAVSRVPALGVDRIDGTAGRGLTLRGLRYEPEQGTEIAVAVARVRLDLSALWRRTLIVEKLQLEGVRVRLEASPDDQQPFSLEPPLDVIVADATVTDATIADETGTVALVHGADLRGRWTHADGIEIEQLLVAAREGRISVQGKLDGASGDWRAKGEAEARWQIGNRTYAGHVQVATTDSAQVRLGARMTSPVVVNVDGSLDQERDEWQADVRVPAFDVRERLASDAPFRVVSAVFHVRGTHDSAALRGNIDLDEETVHIEGARLALRYEPQTLELERLELRINDEPGRLMASAMARLEAEPLTARLEAQWRDIEIPAAWAGQVLSTSGRLAARGNVGKYEAHGRLAIGPPGQLADVRFDVAGTPQQLVLNELAAQQEAGQLAVEGTLDLQPQRGWTLEATAEDFDPGAFFTNWPGRLDIDLRTEGLMEPDGPRGTIALDELRGRLRGRRLQGSGRLEFDWPAALAGTLRVRSGDSTVRIEAAPGASLDARAALHIEDAGDFVPGAAGRLDGDVHVRGRWPEVRVAGTVEGRALVVAGTSVDRFRVVADVRNPTNPSGEVNLKAHDVAAAGGLRFEQVVAEARGSRADHRLTLRATGEPLDVATTLTGSLAPDDAWSGRVARLELGVKDDVQFDLQEPVSVVYSEGSLDVEEACLRSRDTKAQLCTSLSSGVDGTLSADYRLSEVPLSLARVAIPDALPGELEGLIAGDGQVRRAENGLWYGQISLESNRARIVWADEGSNDVAAHPLLIYENLHLEGELDGERANARVTAVIGGAGSLAAHLSVDGLDEVSPRLSGRVQANLPTLEPLAPFVPKVAGLQGRVEVDAQLAGTTAEPLVSGFARAADLAGEVPLLGIELRAGTLSATSRTDGPIALTGAVRSGGGELVLDGSVTRTGDVAATIGGRRFVAADLEGARVVATPDLRFTRDTDGMQLTGDVRIEQAKINLQELPRARLEARSVSPDVVIVNEPPPTATDEAEPLMPLTAAVTVLIEEEAVELTGFGLDATVEGQLTVRDRPGRETTASGQIVIDGTYKAYGQDLTIRKGQVLYAGTPVDNPRLRIEAVREVDDVVAGLRITGSAQDPRIDVFSEPSLGETEALAYLVTGRPVSGIGTAGEGDSDLLQEASESLGTAAGGLLAKRLGQRLGVDEFGIAQSEVIGGAALTIGQYLSPRLYVGFGVGLFDPGQLVTLRYDISKSFSFEAVTSDETTRAGVDYRVER